MSPTDIMRAPTSGKGCQCSSGAVGVWLGFPLADPIVGAGITVAIFFIVWQSSKAVFVRVGRRGTTKEENFALAAVTADTDVFTSASALYGEGFGLVFADELKRIHCDPWIVEKCPLSLAAFFRAVAPFASRSSGITRFKNAS